MSAPELTVGSELEPYRIASVSAEKMKVMAVVLDDPNIIHLDAAAVQKLGLGDRVINQGPSNGGYIMDLLRFAFPEGTLRSFHMKFLANVHSEDELSAGGRIDEIASLGEGREVKLSVWLDVVGVGHALEGTATIVLP
jgi:3-hydroxybutyryl-CoA dehydratase